MTTEQQDNIEEAARLKLVDADVAPAPAKRDRSHRNTGNPPGRPPKVKADAAPSPARGRPSNATRREQQYTRQLGRLGALLFAFNEADGTAFLEGVPRTAKALTEVCEKNPKIGKVLDAGVSAGVWLELGAALSYIAVPIAINHGKLPPIAGVLMSGDISALFPTEPAPADVSPDAPVMTSTHDAAGNIVTKVATMAPANGAGLVDGFVVT